MTKLPILSEHSEQAEFVTRVKLEYRNDETFIPALFYSVVNGFWAAGSGPRKFALLAKYKAEGMNPGVSDCHYDQPRGGYNKLVIEMKRSDKRNAKDQGLRLEQIEYLDAARSVGAFVRVCFCAEEATEAFNEYMRMRPGSWGVFKTGL